MTTEDRKPLTLREPDPSSSETQASTVAENSVQVQPLLKEMGGSVSDDWNTFLGDQVVHTLPKSTDPEMEGRQFNAAVAGLMGIAPKDELEGMMAAQLIAAHNAVMECYRRAGLAGQTPQGRNECLSQASKLSRAYAALLEALNRHRGKGQQKVTVEHVHVYAGGQAVVGVVEHTGGGHQTNSQEQPHAKQIAHASESAMRCSDEDRDAMPIARDDERALPDARRRVARRPEE